VSRIRRPGQRHDGRLGGERRHGHADHLCARQLDRARHVTAINGTVQIGTSFGSFGNVTQTAGTAINASTVNIQTGGSATLDQANTIDVVSGVVYGSDAAGVTINDTTGGLKLTGNIGTWYTGAGWPQRRDGRRTLDLNGQSVAGESVLLRGVGVTSSGGSVQGFSGIVTIDADDGAISLSSTPITTANNSATAVQFLDATGDVAIGLGHGGQRHCRARWRPVATSSMARSRRGA